jgi:hypothetical protein
MVLLSSRISTTDDLTTFVHFVDLVSKKLNRDETAPLVLHPVALPSFPAPDRAAADGIARLREIMARPAVHLWNGGYAGAPGVHLTTEEIAWDLTWARTNPWDSGFSRRLEANTTADFPVLTTAEQARQLGNDQVPPHGPLCLGYAGYTLTGPPSGVQRLWFVENGQWKWLTSLLIGPSTTSDGANETTRDPVDCLHIVVTDKLDLSSLPSAPVGPEMPALRQSTEPPGATFFHSALGRGDSQFSPQRAAGVAGIRASQNVSRDRTAAILRAAAGISAPGAGIAPGGHDPFRNRELQGGVTGSLRLDTDSVGAIFAAGRIAGFTYGDAPLTPPVRCQGFSQTEAGTRYLTSISAAWFTGIRVRGVHEAAQLTGIARLGITTFATDLLPGLALNIAGEDQGDIEEPLLRRALLEIPLHDLDGALHHLTGAILDSTGQIREIDIFSNLSETVPDGASPLEWSVGAVGLRVDLPAASLWMVAAHPGAALPVPLVLGARAVPGGVRISWYPVGFERNAVPRARICPRWSVSYRILAVDRGSPAPVSPRVEHDLVQEIDGFRCQE